MIRFILRAILGLIGASSLRTLSLLRRPPAGKARAWPTIGVLLGCYLLAGCRVEPAASGTVEVTLRDGTIAVSPTEISAGLVTFRLVNRGREVHNLMIEGPGLKRTLGEAMRPSRLRVQSVVLRRGAYSLWCPVPGHRERGEVAALRAMSR